MERILAQGNAHQLLARTKLFQEVLQSIQGPFSGQNSSHCEPDNLEINKKGVFFKIKQAQAALPNSFLQFHHLSGLFDNGFGCGVVGFLQGPAGWGRGIGETDACNGHL